MIRRSLFVAALAILVSLVVHWLGLNITFGGVQPPQENAGQEQPDVVGAFVDVAEEAPQPETPEVIEPDPVITEIPSTEVQIASDDPQNEVTPDTGTAEPPSPGKEASEELDAVEAETENPESDPTEPVETQPAEEVAEAQETAEPEEVTEEDAPEEEVAAEETLAEETPDSEEPETDLTAEVEAAVNAAVSRSLRPPVERPPVERPSAATARDGQETTETAAANGAIQQSGLDLLKSGGFTSRSATSSFEGARARGNSATTNYAGRVLVQLNRAKRLTTTAKGTAQVQFEINPDGSVAWVRVLRSNGSVGIERAAAAQVRSAGPFPRTPSGKPERLGFIFRSQ